MLDRCINSSTVYRMPSTSTKKNRDDTHPRTKGSVKKTSVVRQNTHALSKFGELINKHRMLLLTIILLVAASGNSMQNNNKKEAEILKKQRVMAIALLSPKLHTEESLNNMKETLKNMKKTLDRSITLHSNTENEDVDKKRLAINQAVYDEVLQTLDRVHPPSHPPLQSC